MNKHNTHGRRDFQIFVGIVQYLKDNPKKRKFDIVRQFGINFEKCSLLLKTLIDEGYVNNVGSYYFLTKKGEMVVNNGSNML